MGWLPSYRIESRIYARYILKNLPDAKIAVLYENDDFGKDYLIGLREGLGASADKMIVVSKSYELTDPTVDSQIVSLHASGADVLLTAASAKMAAQAIRKIYDIGWKPTHFLTSVATSVKAVMQPAGPEKAMGIISAGFVKDPTDPQWQDMPEYKDWLTWMKKYNTSVNVADVLSVWGYSSAQTMVAVLKTSGDNLTRENARQMSSPLLRGGNRQFKRNDLWPPTSCAMSWAGWSAASEARHGRPIRLRLNAQGPQREARTPS